MSVNLIGFIVGVVFGGALFLGGLADPDKIVGTLRLKDFHALRTIALFVLIGMVGVWILDVYGHAHFSIKPAVMLSALIGGAFLGVGFGLTGYCPGTGLACAAAGRIDALITVIGMVFGALAYIFLYPSVAMPLDAIANYGESTIPGITGIPRGVWAICLFLAGVLALIVTALRKGKQPLPEDEPRAAR
jgi:uncharacterized membrane protein YedE/YeeE